LLESARYLLCLGRSVIRPTASGEVPPASRRIIAMLSLAVALLAIAGGFNGPGALAGPSSDAEIESLQLRAQRMTLHMGAWVADRERELAPINEVLLDYTKDEALARRVALSLVREGRETGVDARLLLAVLLVENPWLNPRAVSPVGAVGLMQVMPFHAGQWEPCGERLDDIESNICHGARIFAHYLGATNGNIDRALLRYNGCVNGTNTPDCDRYPVKVMARAGRATLSGWRASVGTAAAR
jgi:soluble lytic murein transglycosylase-like protein